MTNGAEQHAGTPVSEYHGAGVLLRRALWGVVQRTLFAMSPRPCHRWRNMLLRLFGADIKRSSRVYPKVIIWGPWNLTMGEGATIADFVNCYCMKRITLGDRAVVSQYTYLCGATHLYERRDRPLIAKPIVIGADTWIAADVFVAPGVTIGEHAVVGARSGVFTDLPAWKVCAGTPAKPLRDRVYQDDEPGEVAP